MLIEKRIECGDHRRQHLFRIPVIGYHQIVNLASFIISIAEGKIVELGLVGLLKFNEFTNQAIGAFTDKLKHGYIAFALIGYFSKFIPGKITRKELSCLPGRSACRTNADPQPKICPTGAFALSTESWKYKPKSSPVETCNLSTETRK